MPIIFFLVVKFANFVENLDSKKYEENYFYFYYNRLYGLFFQPGGSEENIKIERRQDGQ